MEVFLTATKHAAASVAFPDFKLNGRRDKSVVKLFITGRSLRNVWFFG